MLYKISNLVMTNVIKYLKFVYLSNLENIIRAYHFAQKCTLPSKSKFPTHNVIIFEQSNHSKKTKKFSRPILALCRSKVLQNASVKHSAVLSILQYF